MTTTVRPDARSSSSPHTRSTRNRHHRGTRRLDTFVTPGRPLVWFQTAGRNILPGYFSTRGSVTVAGRRVIGVGAAAFAVGLSLSGPQVPTAAADTGDCSAPSPGTSAVSSSPAQASRSAATTTCGQQLQPAAATTESPGQSSARRTRPNAAPLAPTARGYQQTAPVLQPTNYLQFRPSYSVSVLNTGAISVLVNRPRLGRATPTADLPATRPNPLRP